MNQRSMTLSFKQLKKEFRILIRSDDPIGDFKEFYRLIFILQIFIPLRGSTFFPLPQKIAEKKSVMNIKNDDDQCFKWSVTRAWHPVDKNAERITKELKKQSEELDWSGLKFPVELNQIAIFEKKKS